MPEDSEVQENTDDEGDEVALDDIGVQDYKEATGANANSDAAGGKLPDDTIKGVRILRPRWKLLAVMLRLKPG